MLSLPWRAVRAPRGEPELLRAAAEGGAAALWDAHGPLAYAFAHRVLGESDAAADVARDAFLVAHAGLPGTRRGFRPALLGAARIASFDRVGRGTRGAARTPRGGLSAAAGRLRPQQRAALALAGLERLSYAQIATVLGIAPESVAALLARARLRLHDELHGTSLAAASVRSPDCEDVLPVLAAAADGELDAADSAWADPHLARCPTCVRTVRAMAEVAETYAAWSPAPAPARLGEATLAELGRETAAPAPRSGAPALGALSAALLGATCVTGAFAALLVGPARSLHDNGPAVGGARLPEGARSTQVATAPAAERHRDRVVHAHRASDGRGATFVAARPAQPAPAAPEPAQPAPAARRRPQRAPRPRTPPAKIPAPPPAPTPADAGPAFAAAGHVRPRRPAAAGHARHRLRLARPPPSLVGHDPGVTDAALRPLADTS